MPLKFIQGNTGKSILSFENNLYYRQRQNEMRNHFKKCVNEQCLTVFPSVPITIESECKTENRFPANFGRTFLDPKIRKIFLLPRN
ncbi:hypothetical protein BpHYR1_008750 [Brachionus plicatilis]|uniref:Uncharacterized protein n=1 Tax=Brachionus plicatilis TaxID=10195 RepID=A0A3M7QIS4_BRAPC|nr:hypothetical protein BpHYR1_008750 [Brachionus plicatilis]